MKQYFTPILSAMACMACFTNPASADLTTQVVQTLNSQGYYLEPVDAYGSVADNRPDHFTIPDLLLGRANCSGHQYRYRECG